MHQQYATLLCVALEELLYGILAISMQNMAQQCFNLSGSEMNHNPQCETSRNYAGKLLI